MARNYNRDVKIMVLVFLIIQCLFVVFWLL